MRFFDANVGLGRPHKGAWRYFCDAAELRLGLSRFGIERACVMHANAAEASPVDTNAELFRMLEGTDGLVPVPCGLPPGSGELPPPKAFCEAIARRGAAGILLRPKAHTFSPADWCCGELYAAAAERRLPLFLPFEDWPLERVHELCAAHPGLRVVLFDLSYRLGRTLPALLEACPGLRLETSGLVAHRQLDRFCRRFGSERLVFASRMPRLSGGQGLAQLLSADIPDEEKENIAARNVARLVEEVIRD